MIFPYKCEKCGKDFDGSYSIGQAPRVASCPSCGAKGKRVYSGTSISVKVAGGSSSSTFGEQMKSRNAAAGYRMKGRKPPVRVAAYDYGNGKIEEVK